MIQRFIVPPVSSFSSSTSSSSSLPPVSSFFPSVDRNNNEKDDAIQHQQVQQQHSISVLSWNILLPNSQDGWWTYKMYYPPPPSKTTTTTMIASTSNTAAGGGGGSSGTNTIIPESVACVALDMDYTTWSYRQQCIKNRIQFINPDVVCFQEVAQISFESDFLFMKHELGYDGYELYNKKGQRFCPATFWKTSKVQLVTPPVHKDRTLLTTFRTTTIIPPSITTNDTDDQNNTTTTTSTNKTKDDDDQNNKIDSLSSTVVPVTTGGGKDGTKKKKGPKTKTTNMSTSNNNNQSSSSSSSSYWYILNCHLQAGKQGGRRVRQIHEGMNAIISVAKNKLKVNVTMTATHEHGAGTHSADNNNSTKELLLDNVAVIVCGDFNGGEECGAIRYLEDGYVDSTFIEDNESVTSSIKRCPLVKPLLDVAATAAASAGSNNSTGSHSETRPPPPTLVVSELISLLIKEKPTDAWVNPTLSDDAIERFTRIYYQLASYKLPRTCTTRNDNTSHPLHNSETEQQNQHERENDHDSEEIMMVMNVANVRQWLIRINGQVGRGSEFRAAVQRMKFPMNNIQIQEQESQQQKLDLNTNNNINETSVDDNTSTNIPNGTDSAVVIPLPRLTLPDDEIDEEKGSYLLLSDFLDIYQQELVQGKFWGIAYDLYVLGEPLPVTTLYEARYDRMYCTNNEQLIQIDTVLDFLPPTNSNNNNNISTDNPTSIACPNYMEPSDHLPVAARFVVPISIKTMKT